MAKQKDLYTNIVDVTADYLGPAAKRFIDRQVHNHLGKEPAKLTNSDMPTLVDWLRVSFAFLTDDRQMIDELTTRLRRLEN